MEETKKSGIEGHPEGCKCFMCQAHINGKQVCEHCGHCGHCMMHGCGHHAWRWVIKFIVLVIVFVVGFKLGAISTLFHYGNYGYGPGYMMRGYDGYGANNPMMLWGTTNGGQVQSQSGFASTTPVQ